MRIYSQYICNPKIHREISLTNCSIFSSRYGISLYNSLSEKEAEVLDSFVSPLIQKGQSIHHICSCNQDRILYSEKCIYNYLDAGIFSARNLDLPRKVRYRPRKSRHDHFCIDRSCQKERTFKDFQTYLSERPDTPYVELDSVEGIKGGKVLLTIHFVACQFMLAFLRDSNDSQSVIDIFNSLYRKLGADMFRKLFPVCLTDNGSEFSNPRAIEYDSCSRFKTRIFYCDPSAPYQKGAAENNHTLIRRLLPKGTSFDSLTQNKITLMMNHINSYQRKKLGDHSPYDMFQLFYGVEVLKKLGAAKIPSNEIFLLPGLLK